MGISKKTRFLVFDRDKYQCRYCGKSTDDGVILEVDHVVPRSKGGTDEIENLVTACFDCNRGKSNVEIGSTAPEKDIDRRRRLQELRETERAAEELAALVMARKAKAQAWVNTICEIIGCDSVNRVFAETCTRLASEFGDELVIDWVNQISAKFPNIGRDAIMYLNGIARKVREKGE